MLLSALSLSNLFQEINVPEYKHSHNLSKGLYIKTTVLSCQRKNLIKILSNGFDVGEKVHQVHQSVSTFVYQMTAYTS